MASRYLAPLLSLFVIPCTANEPGFNRLCETTVTTPAEEQYLIEASQHGDVESFNQLVRQYEGRIYTLCYRMLGNREAAADVTQDTFFSAFQHVRRFRGGSFRSWVFRIATNRCYDVLRSQQRHPLTSLDAACVAEDGSPGFDPPDHRESPDEVALRHELSAAIQRALIGLPEDQRVVVILADVQGLPYEEIAQITRVSIGTVKSRLSRGRARLRDALKAGELLPERYRHESEQQRV